MIGKVARTLWARLPQEAEHKPLIFLLRPALGRASLGEGFKSMQEKMLLLLPVEWMKPSESGMLPLFFFIERVSMQRANQWNERKSAKGKDMLLHRCAASSQTSQAQPDSLPAGQRSAEIHSGKSPS